MDKVSLRKEYLSKRNNLNSNFVDEAGAKIFEILKSTKILNFQKILIYSDFRNEVKTQSITDYLFENGREVYLPVCDVETRTFECVKYNGTFCANAYGILEPKNGCRLDCKEKIDCAIIPGVIFDTSGNRIGFGAGYYDKFLSKNPQVYKIGICYDFQLCESLPCEEHDAKMDLIITEKRKISTE